MPAEIAVVGLITSLIGTGASIKASKDAEKARERQRRQAKKLRDVEALNASRQRRSAFRVALARSINAAAVQGTSGSSLEGGVLGSLSGQFASGEGITSARLDAANKIDAESTKIGEAQTLAGVGSGLQTLGSGLFSNADSVADLGKELFGP